MPTAARAAGAGILIAGPTALAFFSGGYFDRPRIIAGLVAGAVLLLAAVTAERPLPRTASGRVALAGLAALCAWTALSLLWTPVTSAAVDDLQRVLLYAAYVTAGVALLRERWVADAIEPALAGGALIVTSYALSERVLPDLVELSRSVTAGGRLEQPLTYWNALGALAAIGLVLALRVAGDPRRGPYLRAASAAAAVPLTTGVYLSFSRGALAALAVGLVALVALAPAAAPQLRAVAAGLGPGIVAAVLAGALPAVRTLGGSASARRLEGLVMLAALLLLAAVSAALVLRQARDGRPTGGALQLPRRSVMAAGIVLLLVGGALAAAALEAQPEASGPAFGANAQRLRSIESNRYEYWRVALETFADHPVRGIGSGAFVVEWLQKRTVLDPTREAHSIYLGTLAELGLVGFAALLAFLGGIAAAAVRLWRRHPGLATGPLAALAVWVVHSGLDWDWEMPALTLVALALAAAVVAWDDREDPAGASRAPLEGSADAPAPAPLASAPGPSPP